MVIKHKKVVRLVVKVVASALNLFKKEFLRKPRTNNNKKEKPRYENSQDIENRWNDNYNSY